MNTETVKGFRDIEGQEALKQNEIKKIISEIFELCGFEIVETPVIEYEEFVKGNNVNDEAVSDIFKLSDKGKRNLALRYEFTFQLKRLAQNKKLPYKRFQIGPVFRDEPISANRSRQFTQCDVDIIGSTIRDEAEILYLTKEILDKLNIKYKIYINNKKLLNEILDEQKITNKNDVIKEIDKLDKLTEKEVKTNLKKYKAEKLLSVFKNKEAYFKKYSSYKYIEELKKYCKFYGVKVEFSSNLARGLSYYNGNVFEIKSNLKETICAGGSYLINGIQSTGISFGVERISQVSKLSFDDRKALVISIDRDKEAINLVKKLRKNKIKCSLFYGKPSKALEYCNSKNIQYAIFLGEEEIKKRKFTFKDLKSGKESKLSEKDMVKKLKS